MSWNKLFKIAGKAALYICLVIVVILNIVEIFVPLNIIEKIVPNSSVDVRLSITMSLIGITLIAILANMDKLLARKKVPMASDKFFDGLNAILSSKKIVKSLDIFAYTSRTYCACIRDADIIIKKVRLLVHKPRSITGEKLLNTSKFAVSQDTIALWQNMLKNKKILSLEIKYFDFEPTYHFAIIDNKFYHFGFYLTQSEHPGYSLLTSFSSPEVTDESEFFKKDFVILFDNYFDNYSYSEDNLGK
jgi:hypothetical protein